MAEVTLNRPNWLSSAVGLVSKTITIPSDFATYVSEVDADGVTRKIVKSGTYVATPYKGLLLRDIDITGGAQLAPLMIAGYYIDANLPATVASHVADLKAQGLFAVTEGATTRPDFGSVLPIAINYQSPVYLYPLGGSTFEMDAEGYFFTLTKGTTSGIDYQINVSGTIPLIKAATKTGLGYDEAITNIFVALIEIQADNFDLTKAKYCRHGGTLAALTADDVCTINGKTYLINAFGVYDTDGAGAIGNKVASAENMNLIDIQYNGVTKVYKYTYNFGELAE